MLLKFTLSEVVEFFIWPWGRDPCILGTRAWLTRDYGLEISVFSPPIAFGCCCILFDGRGQRTSTQ